jgi:hypothetical protein
MAGDSTCAQPSIQRVIDPTIFRPADAIRWPSEVRRHPHFIRNAMQTGCIAIRLQAFRRIQLLAQRFG